MTLSKEDREVLVEASERAAEGRRVLAVAGYGSKVAGYSRPDSDYDVLTVVDKLRPHAKYVYGEVGGAPFSALVVEQEAFERDAREGFLGEFVAGRLLNIYEAVVGEEYLLKTELDLKRRVVLETVEELLERYGAFAEQMLIPSSYFLFNKLKKRAFVYPPVLYSYVSTYSPPQKERNLRASLIGFERALQGLVADGLLRTEGEYYALSRGAEAKIRAPRFADILRLAERGIKQYITHGFAGTVGPNTALKELASKINRARTMTKLPEELNEPRGLIRLPEGLLLFTSDWLQEVARALGISMPYDYRTENMGEFFSTATLFTLSHREGVTKVVAKRYQDLWSFKWVVANLMTVTAKQFESRPMVRMTREYKGTMALRKAGVRVPKILAVCPEDKLIVKEFVDGETLESWTKKAMDGAEEGWRKVEAFGEALGKIHSANYCLGDSKPGNVVFGPSGLYIVDLEQADEGGDQPWDVVEFLYYSAIPMASPDMARQLVKTFKMGYLRTGFADNLRKAADVRYAIPFQLLVQPPVSTAVREELSSG